MAWTCNINRRGRVIRGILGALALAGGVYLILRTEHDFWGVGACALGVFALIEAIVGWCAIRALGIDTPW